MPGPSEVNPRNFRVVEVLYDVDGFSIAWGQSEDGTELLGMRWNGDAIGDPGYPKTFGNPVWFFIPPELSRPFADEIGRIKKSVADPSETTSAN